MEPTWSAAETENNVIGFNLTEFNKCENKFQTNYRVFDQKLPVTIIPDSKGTYGKHKSAP